MPPSNFARNSPEGVSGFEIRSLIFRGFRATGEWGPGGITCDFGVGRGRIRQGVWGVDAVWLGERLGCGWGGAWGADLVRMSAPGSFWGVGGTEVLCVRRWEEV